MASLDSFLSRLMPSVPGCSDMLAKQVLVDTATDFCERTNIVRVVQDLTGLNAETRAYDLEIPNGTQLARVLKVFVGPNKMGLVPIEFVDSPYAYFDTVAGEAVETGTPRVAHLVDDYSISLFPPPAEDSPLALSVVFSVKPTPAATTLPDELFNHWLEPIVEGAKARLFAVPNAAFANLGMLPVSGMLYAAGVSRAQVESRLGRARTTIHVRSRAFAI